LTDSTFQGRREDGRLVTGRGRYTADHNLPGQAVGHFLRADRAHARIVTIDASTALGMEGVVGVLTGLIVLFISLIVRWARRRWRRPTVQGQRA
jgi:carbon-monoxide dehydrogenase large subunit